MEVRTVRRPGDPGTRKLVARYGDRLVCVRYAIDAARGKRYKTIELIVTEENWTPPPAPQAPALAPPPKPRHTPRVPLRIQWFEKDLQRQVKAAGGLWDAKRKLWYVPEEQVKRLGLDGRIVR